MIYLGKAGNNLEEGSDECVSHNKITRFVFRAEAAPRKLLYRGMK